SSGRVRWPCSKKSFEYRSQAIACSTDGGVPSNSRSAFLISGSPAAWESIPRYTAARRWMAPAVAPYCNGGYVVLALIAERVSGVPFPRLRFAAGGGPPGG